MTQSQFCINFALATLAIWRVTHLLANEDGPADIIVKLRTVLGDSLAGKLMDCFKCLSLWISAPAALFVTRTPLTWLFVWLALSGAACLLQRAGQEQEAIQADVQAYSQSSVLTNRSEGEVSHVLWSEKTSSAERPALWETSHVSAPADAPPAAKQAPNGAYHE